MTDSQAKVFVRNVLSPLVAIASSPDLDELCQQNHISSFTELIKPFGIDIEGKVSLRDTKGLVKSLSHTSIRFVELNRLDPSGSNNDDALLSRNLSDLIKNQARASEILRADPLLNVSSPGESPEENPDEITLDEPHNPQLIQALLSKSMEELTPWFNIYRNSFFQHLRISEHETFDHPVACLAATSTSNPNPIETLTKLHEQKARLSQWAFINPELFQCYLLVHDVRQGNIETAQKTLEKMKKAFGVNCQLLLINSRPSGRDGKNMDSIVPDVWNKDVWILNSHGLPLRNESFKVEVSKPSQTQRSSSDSGKLLSMEDFDALKSFVKKLYGESILPHMERCMHLWNEQVASSRRGFTGRLFSASRRYFGGARVPPTSNSSSGSSTSSTHSSSYHHNTPEAQLRKLADYAFMMRDYDFARSTYETVKKDYQADSSWKYYAGAQEMTGLCLLFTETSGARIDMERYYDKAIRYYQSSKMGSWAARCVLLFHSMLKFHRRYEDIPLLMARLTGEESDLRSALFLEQAAHGYLKSSLPRVRKFAFHLILAGHRYNKCNQREHAYYCYQLAARVFGINEKKLNDNINSDSWLREVPSKKWGLIEDHISFSLGRQSYHLGELQKAIQHFSWLLHESNQPQSVQAGYIKEFMYIYKNYIASTGHEILLEPDNVLPIPVVDPKSVHLRIPSASLPQNDTTSVIDEHDPIWNKLASDLISPSPLHMFDNGLVSSPNLREPELQMCPLKEVFYLSVDIHNSLHIPISLSQIALSCQYEGASSSGGINVTPVENMTLEGQQKTTVSFCITPLHEGVLNILGLSLMVNDHARTFKSFSQRGPRLNMTNKQRQGRYYAPYRALTVRVVQPFPKLALELEELPSSIMSGEIVKGHLKLRNIGNANLSRLSVRLTHPTYFTFGSHDDNSNVSSSPFTQISVDESSRQGEVAVDNTIQDTCSRPLNFCITSNGDSPTSPSSVLQPDQTAEVDVYLRGDRVGTHKFYFIFYYYTEDESSKIVRFRVAKLCFQCVVSPSLKINAFTRPSTQVLGRYILGLEIENVQSDKSFRINQISSVGHKWRVACISTSTENSASGSLILAPRQTASLYYSINQLVDPLSATGLELSTDSDGDHSPEIYLTSSLQGLTLGRQPSVTYPPLTLTYSNSSLTPDCQNFWIHPSKNLYLNSRIQNRINWLNKEMSILEPKLARASFPLFLSNDIDVALCWEALVDSSHENIPSRQGHHYIIGIHLGAQQNLLFDHVPTLDLENKDTELDSKDSGSLKDNKISRSLFEGTATERHQLIRHISSHPRFTNDNPIHATLCSDTEFFGDFNNKKLVEFPVFFFVQNWSWNREVDITINLLSTVEPKDASPHGIHGTESQLDVPCGSDLNTAGFWWRGPQKLHARLQPKESTRISAHIIVNQPGVYDLNRWHLEAVVQVAPSKSETYRRFLAAALESPEALETNIQHKLNPPLPHLVHVYPS